MGRGPAWTREELLYIERAASEGATLKQVADELGRKDGKSVGRVARRHWIRFQLGCRPDADKRSHILAAVGRDEVTMADLCARTGRSRDSLKRIVRRMVRDGLLVRLGTGRRYTSYTCCYSWRREWDGEDE